MISLFRKEDTPTRQFLKNTHNLPEIRINRLTDNSIYTVNEKDYLSLIKFIDSLNLSKYITVNTTSFSTFETPNSNFNQLYSLYLINLRNKLEMSKNYYVSDRKVILYGLKSCLTKIPLHLAFFENLWNIFTFNYDRKEFIAYPINQDSRTPDLNKGIVIRPLGICPSFWLEDNQDIMYWTKPINSYFID